MADSVLQKPKSSGKPRMQPQFPGIGGHSAKKMDFMEIGQRLYDLVGVELSGKGIKAGAGIPGAGYIEGDKWGLGMWHDMPNPFRQGEGHRNEPPSKLGFHLTRRI
tara:strand:- start:184 stop:501 length:318 start_codon:yes stop_codon:yes gene_type:complete